MVVPAPRRLPEPEWYLNGMSGPDSESLRVRIVSGGQTGVDQAALDLAMALGLEHGGWCPRGRLCESGRIHSRYQLRESHSPRYDVRTEQNVEDSDGTLILYHQKLNGGTALTLRMAQKYQRPFLMVDLAKESQLSQAAAGVRMWLLAHTIRTLNIAGPRESSCPGIHDRAFSFLRVTLAAC